MVESSIGSPIEWSIVSINLISFQAIVPSKNRGENRDREENRDWEEYQYQEENWDRDKNWDQMENRDREENQVDNKAYVIKIVASFSD